MGVGAGLYMYVVVVQKFTFAISSPDEFLLSSAGCYYTGTAQDGSAGRPWHAVLVQQTLCTPRSCCTKLHVRALHHPTLAVSLYTVNHKNVAVYL